MSEKQKHAVFWAVYVFLVVLGVVGYLYPVIAVIVFREQWSVFSDWFSITGSILSVVSLAFGILSLFLSTRSQSRSDSILEKLKKTQDQSNQNLRDISELATQLKSGQEKTANAFEQLQHTQHEMTSTLKVIRSVVFSIQGELHGVKQTERYQMSEIEVQIYDESAWKLDPTGKND